MAIKNVSGADGAAVTCTANPATEQEVEVCERIAARCLMNEAGEIAAMLVGAVCLIEDRQPGSEDDVLVLLNAAMRRAKSMRNALDLVGIGRAAEVAAAGVEA